MLIGQQFKTNDEGQVEFMSLALIFGQPRLKGGNSHDWSGILGHLGSNRVALCIFTHPLLLLFKLILLDLILWERNAWLAKGHYILDREKSIQWQLLGPLTFEPIAGQSIGHWMLGLEPWDPGRVHYSGKPCGHLPIRASPAFLLLRLLPTSSHLIVNCPTRQSLLLFIGSLHWFPYPLISIPR